MKTKNIQWDIINDIFLEIEEISNFLEAKKEKYLEKKYIIKINNNNKDELLNSKYILLKNKKIEKEINDFLKDANFIIQKIQLPKGIFVFSVNELIDYKFKQLSNKDIIENKKIHNNQNNLLQKIDLDIINKLKDIYFLDLFKTLRYDIHYSKKDRKLFNIIYIIYNHFEKKGGILFYPYYFFTTLLFFEMHIDQLNEIEERSDMVINLDFNTKEDMRIKRKILNILKK